MKEIEKNLYHLPISLPKSPLGWVNCYLIRGAQRHLLIDTAFNHDECEKSLLDQLAEIGVAIEDTDIFVTHFHVDHSGLIGRLKRPQNTIYASAPDKEWINSMQNMDHSSWFDDGNLTMGVPDAHKIRAKDHVAHRLKSGGFVDLAVLREGDRFEIGGFDLRVIDLYGHTPGQIGLWEPDKKYLFCGDHILNDISPNITAWDLSTDYLGIYIDSLEKVRSMPVSRLFPAHRDSPPHINERIDWLKEHHHERSAAIVHILSNSKKPMTAFEVAILLEWSIKGAILEAPLQQLWFACTETLAHLQSLLFKSNIARENRDGTLYFLQAL